MRRLFLLVAAIVLVDTMFFAALTPLLPQYADELGLSKAGAGVLAAAYPVGVLLAGIPGGFAAARFGVRPTAVAGLLVMAATTLTFGFADSIWLLDAARLTQGLASALAWAAGLAWLTSAAPASRRGELIGSAMAAAIVGALLGPVLGGAASLVGTETAFGVVAALTLALAAWARATPASPPAEPQPVRAVLEALADPEILRSSWFVALPALLFGVLNVLAPLRLAELGLAAAVIGGTFLVAAAVEATASPLLGRLSDRRGRLVPLRFSLAGSAVVATAFPWVDHSWLLAALVVAAAPVFGGFWAPALSQLADDAEARGLDHAYGFALVNVAWAPGQAAGAAGGGALAGATSDVVPFLALAVACLLTLASVRRLRRPEAAPQGDATRTGAVAAGPAPRR